MLKGDLSNVVQPRLLLVFEGALGHISDSQIGEFNRFASDDDWTGAWMNWTINEQMAGTIWRVVRDRMVQVSLVSYIAPDNDDAAEGLQTLMDLFHLPISEVICTSPLRMAHDLAYMNDVAFIYDANPESWAMYGRKGRALTNVNDFGRF